MLSHKGRFGIGFWTNEEVKQSKAFLSRFTWVQSMKP